MKTLVQKKLLFFLFFLLFVTLEEQTPALYTEFHILSSCHGELFRKNIGYLDAGETKLPILSGVCERKTLLEVVRPSRGSSSLC